MPSNAQRQREYRARRKAANDVRLDMTISIEARDALRRIATADHATQRETLERTLLVLGQAIGQLEQLARVRQEPATQVLAQMIAQAEAFHTEKAKDARTFYGRREQLLPGIENMPNSV